MVCRVNELKPPRDVFSAPFTRTLVLIAGLGDALHCLFWSLEPLTALNDPGLQMSLCYRDIKLEEMEDVKRSFGPPVGCKRRLYSEIICLDKAIKNGL